MITCLRIALCLLAGFALAVSASELVIILSGGDGRYPYGVNDSLLYDSRPVYVAFNAMTFLIGSFLLAVGISWRRFSSALRVGATFLGALVMGYVLVRSLM